MIKRRFILALALTAFATQAFGQAVPAPSKSSAPKLRLNTPTFGNGNYAVVTCPDALGAVTDYACVQAYTAPVSAAATGVAAAGWFTNTNTTSTVGTTGHYIGGFGNVTDTTAGRITLYGFEGRADGRSTDASGTHSYVGVAGRGYWQGTALPDTVWVIAHDATVSITTDGSTPHAHGVAVGYYMPAIVGGNPATKYSFYAAADPIFAGGGVTSAGTKISNAGLLNVMPGTTVSSAATIAITGNVFHVSGTASITSISGTGVPTGTCVTLIFDSTATLTDGSNLKMAGNLVATADDTWSGCYDGSNWYETARSVN